MIKISRWAKQNPWKTRFGIAVLYVLIAGCAVLLGRNLWGLGIQVSGVLLFSSLTLFVAGALCYPNKKHNRNNRNNPHAPDFYSWQKTCDFLLAFSAFLVISALGNTGSGLVGFPGILKSTATTMSTVVPIEKEHANGKPIVKVRTTKAERKALFRELKKLLRTTFKGPRQRDLNSGTRITLVVLSIVAGVILSILLASLACSLSCSGSESLAAFVAIFGSAAIAGLLILAIRSIYRRYPKVLVPVEPLASN